MKPAGSWSYWAISTRCRRLCTDIVLTLLVGGAGGFAGYKSKIPAGSLIGSLAFTTVYSMISGHAQSFAAFRVIAQIIAGLFIGMQLASCDLKAMLQLYKPILILVTGMLGINVTVGLILHNTTGLDLMTALFAATPGGISETSVISAEMGANTLQVSVLQFFRMLSGFLIFPLLAQWLIRRLNKGGRPPVSTDTGMQANRAKSAIPDTALVIIMAAAAGILGYLAKFSGGVLVFSMLAVGLLGQGGKQASVPRMVKRWAQMLSGTYIGATLSLSDVTSLKELFMPTILLVGLYLVLCLILGWVLYRFCRLKASEAFFSCIPAGVSDMALMASDLGAGGPVVAILQLFRFSSAVAISPSVILLVTQWLG